MNALPSRVKAAPAALLLAILAAGVWFVWWMAGRADREQRADLLQQARLVAQAVNVQHVQALSGTEADLDHPVYRRFKEQFSTVRSATPQCRFVYLMGRKTDGTVFFFVDNEPPDSKDYSPPGQVYEEVPASYRRVFDTKTAAVAGPVIDRWGTWVSALVPLTDPQTGAVVAVLGMDIDARDWKWDVAARAALPVGLMLVLLIGVTAAFASVRRVDASPKPVLRRLLLPLATMVVLLLAVAGALLRQQYQRQLDGEIAADIVNISGDLHTALKQEASILGRIALPIAADATVQKALRKGDADRLLATWRPVFETLRREKCLMHFSFLDKNRVCILRVHKPEKRGDRIERFTALEAERTGKTASGIELGPLGTFTLRVVQPVFEGGKLAGHVELGKEIADVLETLGIRSVIQLAVLIRKENLDRQGWEEGMRLLGRQADWNRLPRSVVIYASQGRLPDAFASWADPVAGEHAHRETDREMVVDGKDWRISAMPLQDASGKAVGDLLVMSDISTKKTTFAHLMVLGGAAGTVLLMLLLSFVYVLLHRTDASIRAQQVVLRESEERYRAIMEELTEIICRFKADGTITFVNEVYCRFFGKMSGELLGSKWQTVVVLEDVPIIEERLRILSPDNPVVVIENRVCSGSGEVRWMQFVNRAFFDTADRPVEIQSVGRDITERKRVEESQRQLATAVEQAAETIVITDPDGTILYANPAFEKITGYTRAEALGQNPRILKSGKHDAEFYRKIWATLTAGRVWSGHIINKHKNGTLYEEDATISPILDAAGKIVNFVAVKRDVTQEMAIQKQLLQAQKLEAVGQLAGGVAHDFNNLLMVIGGYTSLLMKRLPEEHPGRNMIGEIRKAAERGAALTQQLLAFGRKQATQIRRIQINEVIEESGKMLNQLLRADIRVIRTCAPDLVPVMGDFVQMGQVLTNLMVNARDAMPKGGTLTIETSNLDATSAASLGFEGVPEGQYAMLCVRDTGEGMTPEVQSHLFEPFFTTKGQSKGTGLGLSIVYGIVKRSDGHIAVQSRVGEGSSFFVLLPEARKTSPVGKEPRTGAKAAVGIETILLVEDEEALRRVTEEILRSEGYRVIQASEAQEALRALRDPKNEIHLMLSDVVMPGMQGSDLAEKALRLRPELKVILMSGYSDKRIMDRVFSQEKFVFLPKPVPHDQLLRKLREVLDGG